MPATVAVPQRKTDVRKLTSLAPFQTEPGRATHSVLLSIRRE
jgi:hypothetical protein